MIQRKRDRLLSLVRLPSQLSQRPAASQPSAAGPSLAAIPPPSPGAQTIKTAAGVGEKLFHEAFAALTVEEQGTIQQYIAQGAQDVRTVVQKAQSATEYHRKVCEDKRWQWHFRGRTVLLRDVADKVTLWLNRFKSAGDVVANVSPLYVGLPWAGVRILLEMAVADNHQMAALLTGMDLVLSIASRLEVYITYHCQLPATLAMTNFEKALARTYAHIMKFFATTLQEYEKSSAQRFLQALWTTSALENFESENDKLAARLEVEASNCDRDLSAIRWQEAQQWKSDLTSALQKLSAIQSLQSSLTSLHVKVDLSKLVIVEGATYNSYADATFATCLQGTRTDILQQITDWANDPNGKCVFWLCGMAGTGKSTISRTVAHTLDQQAHLGASFFFKRGEGDRGSARRLFATLAVQMADRIPGLGEWIASAVDADSVLGQRNLQEQFEKLLLQPLLSLPSRPTAYSVIAIVIDALDECDREMDVRMIIPLLTKLHVLTSYHFRIFLTSRPELPVQLGFGNVDGSLHQDVKLEKVQASTIDHDIRLFFEHSFKDIVEKDQSVEAWEPLPTHWPGRDAIENLTSLAIPLFIFAFTVCRYISESNPRERLEQILQQDDNKSLTGIDKTYVPILNQLVSGLDEREREKVFDSFQELIGAIVLVGEPLSAQSYSSLLGLSLRNVGTQLRGLHSVLNIPKDKDVPIRPFHLSFRDFLLDDGHVAAGRFQINEKQRHARLAAQCLKRLSREGTLKADQLCIGKPGVRRAEISTDRIQDVLRSDVAYACSYWVFHVIRSEQKVENNGDVHKFLKLHLLHWWEVLSWLGRLSSAVASLSELLSATELHNSSHVAALLNDAKRLLVQNRYIIDLAPLQLYSSAMVFAPKGSVTRSLFHGQHDSQLQSFPVVPLSWTVAPHNIIEHRTWIRTVAFSPDGENVASASDDGTVRIWNAQTGEVRHTLTGHEDWVTVVTFSPNRETIASASYDRTVRLWDVQTGEVRQILTDHDDLVTAVVFSGSGHIIASACDDRKVRLWNAQSGNLRHTLIGHKNWVRAVAFSPDELTVASGSDDRTVRLWDTRTGELKQELTEHEDLVRAVAFALRDQVVASASYDKTVLLWNAQTGERSVKLTGHKDWVRAVAFSLDGQMVVSASDDRAVRLWNARTGEMRHTLIGHEDWVRAVAFSSDGQTVASASDDQTVRLWDTQTGEVRKILAEHEGRVKAVAFSPVGQLVAAASDDRTVRLWDAQTGELRHTLTGHDRQIIAVAISPSGQTVASASNDGKVRLWDVQTGIRKQEFEAPLGIFDFAFAPDGQSLETNKGRLDLSLHPESAQTSEPPSHSSILRCGEWLRYNNNDELWLPYEYRGTCSVLNGNLIVIGQVSGAITFIKFR